MNDEPRRALIEVMYEEYQDMKYRALSAEAEARRLREELEPLRELQEQVFRDSFDFTKSPAFAMLVGAEIERGETDGPFTSMIKNRKEQEQ